MHATIHSPSSPRRTVTVIQKYTTKRIKRPVFRQFFHAKSDEKLFATWKSDLNQFRRVFDVSFSTPV